MQPNYYGAQVAQQTPQPQLYQFQQSSNIKPPKKFHTSVLFMVFFMLAFLGLLAYVLVDKFLLTKTVEVTPEQITTTMFSSLSSLNIPNDEQYTEHMTQALAGRLFVINGATDQSVKFTSQTEYEYIYYRTPSTDRRKIQPSKKYGTYKLNNKTITLDCGDEFRIEGDYLVKSKDEVSKNQDTVYFDAYQLYNVSLGIDNALNDYLKSTHKATDVIPVTDKTHINLDTITCNASDRRLSTADSFLCNVNYTMYYTETDTNNPLDDYEISVNTTTPTAVSRSATASGEIIVRISNNINYRITGHVQSNVTLQNN